MEEEDYKKAKKIQDEIIKLTTRYNNITHALERGGCGMKAEISYTPGHSFSKRTAIIFNKEVIKQALICEQDVVKRELDLLKEEFQNL